MSTPTPVSPYAITPIIEEFTPPEQFFPVKDTSREKRLLLAILEEAICCLYATLPRGTYGVLRIQRLRQEARDWIESRDRSHICSFERICEALDYDADTLRAAVLRDGFRLHTQGWSSHVSGGKIRVGTKDYLEEIDRTEQRRQRRSR